MANARPAGGGPLHPTRRARREIARDRGGARSSESAGDDAKPSASPSEARPRAGRVLPRRRRSASASGQAHRAFCQGRAGNAVWVGRMPSPPRRGRAAPRSHRRTSPADCRRPLPEAPARIPRRKRRKTNVSERRRWMEEVAWMSHRRNLAPPQHVLVDVVVPYYPRYILLAPASPTRI